jgi:hypothetical protein
MSYVCLSANRKSANLLWLIRKSKIRQFLSCASPLTSNLQIFNIPVDKEKESQSEENSVSKQHLNKAFENYICKGKNYVFVDLRKL